MAVSFMNWSISIVGRVLARNKVVTSVKVKVVLFKVQPKRAPSTYTGHSDVKDTKDNNL